MGSVTEGKLVTPGEAREAFHQAISAATKQFFASCAQYEVHDFQAEGPEYAITNETFSLALSVAGYHAGYFITGMELTGSTVERIKTVLNAGVIAGADQAKQDMRDPDEDDGLHEN